MSRCEDYPFCGHEPGCCPDFDESGRQLNMKCVCGATVPLTSKVSLCPACLNGTEMPDGSIRPNYTPSIPEDWDCRDCDDFDECGGDGSLRREAGAGTRKFILFYHND